MGDLLAFKHKTEPSRRREPNAGSAEIILFTGVRYERMEEPVQPLKPPSRRAPKRREKAKKEKAS